MLELNSPDFEHPQLSITSLRPIPQKSSRIHRYSGQVYYWDPVSPDQAPSKVCIDGKEYCRFMDLIFIPNSTERLTRHQTIMVNRLRASLINDHNIDFTDRYVKSVFAEVLNGTASRVIDWGCGFHPLFPGLHTTDRLGVDIDPKVVTYHAEAGQNPVILVDDLVESVGDGWADAIASVFVFHFAISEYDAQEMNRVLSNDGYLCANVYRRSKDSRRQLREILDRAGIHVIVVSDPSCLCRNHEYWLGYKNFDSPKVQLALQILRSRLAQDQNAACCLSS